MNLLFKHAWLGWIFFIVMPFLQKNLPEAYGQENGVIENIQLVFLFLPIFLLWSSRNGLKKDWGGNKQVLCYAGMLFFLVLIGRELSWGRALLMDEAGHVPGWSELGLYGKIAHPMVGLLIVGLLYCLYKAKIWKFLVSIWRLIPWLDVCLLLLYVCLAYIGEHMHCSWWNGELAEELAETGAYYMMFWTVWKILKTLKE